MKKILLILAHPDKNSLNGELFNFYSQSARDKGFEVKELLLGDLNFNLNLKKGYKEIQELEDDLKIAQESILWADHLVFIFPIWWYSFPAILKGFIDRLFLPGFAFKYQNKFSVKKLLAGKTADIICTSGNPSIYYLLIKLNNGANNLKSILKFCGIKVKNKIIFGGVSKDLSKQRLDVYKKNILKIIKIKKYG